MTPANDLRRLGLASCYRSDQESIVESLYVPALTVASNYSRAVGYFTSASLRLMSEGLDAFNEHGGTIRLVVSPQLATEDVEDIQRGYEIRDVLERATLRTLNNLSPADLTVDLGTLGTMIAAGSLEIKIAFVQRGDGFGIYHEKIGYFEDPSGNTVAMSGSANETYLGMMENFETVEVFRGWLPGDDERASRIVRDFEALWNDSTRNLRVVSFPDVAKERLIKVCGSAREVSGPAAVSRPRGEVLRPPRDFIPRDYQVEAIRSWLTAQGRGTLRMATGTGKTKTALAAASRVAAASLEAERPLVLLVVVPYQHLVDQWLEELVEFGVSGIGIYESSEKWLPIALDQIAAARAGRRPFVAMVATNASFSLPIFQGQVRNLGMQLMIIGDEAHNLGSRRYRELLPEQATYRLALSATPERWFDQEGTEALFDYFGPVVFELSLDKAIQVGALCRYKYYPRLVELTGFETGLYAALTTRIGRLLGEGADPEDEDGPLGSLLRKRAAVLGHAAGKLPMFESDAERRLDQWWQLVYCAEGRTPTEDGYAQGPSQLEQATALIGNDLGASVHSYVSETDRALRRRLLARFATGDDLQFITAMRCLDEGVDIPDARVAYILSSSSNPRQFIQRRGRILRRAPGKDYAEILDYIAFPGPQDSASAEVERKLLRRELMRAGEFGKLADNYEFSLNALRPLKLKYDLLDI